jgi:hypothetical protein
MYAQIIAELERVFKGADQEIAAVAADLFIGTRVQLSSLKSV